ncbi:Hypothetical predicted protein [Marmota monax]|uniref:Uncharacterized protein n=1 Tax=Marmota monax TaxID=9995 RepID=A0A5E4AH63_MARMO|nr:hypothetical protein GHT09_006176 [Marmota monax]VTJ56525.1 Hypothetical predicted protein [Marmota monax]
MSGQSLRTLCQTPKDAVPGAMGVGASEWSDPQKRKQVAVPGSRSCVELQFPKTEEPRRHGSHSCPAV